MFTTWLVYQLSRLGGKVRVVNPILVGIAVNAIAGAVISFFIFFAPTTSREQIIFWQMGTLSGAKWEHVGVVGVVGVNVAFGLLCAWLLVKQLDLLALGDKAATHVGVDVSTLRTLSIVLATLLTAGAVSYALLIPASALGCALLIAGADIGSRTIIPFADLPIGIFTALVGGPTFFILLRRMKKKGRVYKSMLKVTGVSIDIAGKRIVDNVSFTARTGTVTGLIGPNGTGHPTFWC